MKVLTAQEIRDLDQYTIIHEPVLSIDLMERSAKGVKRWIAKNLDHDMNYHIFCGAGNNGGDGLALARLMKKEAYNVHTHLVKYLANLSIDCSTNEKRLAEIDKINYIESENDFPDLKEGDVVIDAIFGSGLNRAAEGISQNVISYINSREVPVVSIDVPSGIFCNNPTPLGDVIHADVTLSFQLPKLSFLVPENEEYIGQWTVLDIGLSEEGIEQSQNTYNYILQEEVSQIILPPSKFTHKGENGHGLLVAGSKGKTGASILAAKAALRSGIGLLTAAITERNYTSFQAALPEAMCVVQGEVYNTRMPENLNQYSTIAVGPGLGITKETAKLVADLAKKSKQPMIIDADAINIIAENKKILKHIPKYSVFTPHVGEFDRLVGESKNTFERLEKLLDFSVDNEMIVVLKGAHSAIAIPSGQVYINSSGNPGMATAGSGDVLTGMLLGLIAQGYHPVDATILGVYLHGLSGDIQIQKQSYESLIAGDLIDGLGTAFKVLMGEGLKQEKNG